ncbi:50S ribosomal protein L11 methyltransferase [Cellvibrio japonicus]|uniref:Ribosomal protein L11 methyltransferase n=1 Tax=Cellvibrio japonicus (strain Ueda107) TaxID=498211 RepID=PRMA_CELJU|nr:50S ribosomal protein L11 methyltransferase [Cellvibrio japonicus]B3PBH5.1 RecName: Full=Ribosomal protein L11 methyltransferase; Short=L11 Mtase [Cellvibrio japonicus Ueda107]ACE85647.1 ribosomal protein L11 methyltransferase [Cellvibrio japonicus Ueda107]QEI13091.1 50S ribosomal protein L11 methyltransferase [Cellvibrio japonicus]QEI16665.1 50S ribosomal protein L11 methyltransferase [Cellvibrio japonicus]QEI20243.1 50S ribosomal protein L11 methyltransferase [Cellvibrio japonicus]
MPWLQLKVIAPRRYVESIENALLAAGAASVTLQDNADQPIFEPGLGETPLWDNVKITGLFDAEIDTAKAIALAERRFGNPLPQHQWEQLEDKDWEREWMSNYHAIRCGERLWICPSWQEPPEPDKINLMLDPGLAFGTGTHPTTFLCMQWIDQQDFTDLEVIDYGCGSGILGIAALLLGARKVVGVDIDPQALLATTENAKRNQLPADAMPVYLPPHCPATQVDVMLANILAGPLAELAPTLSNMTKPGGKLCLSGILSVQAQSVMDAYAPWFDFDPVATHEEWVRLTAIKARA